LAQPSVLSKAIGKDLTFVVKEEHGAFSCDQLLDLTFLIEGLDDFLRVHLVLVGVGKGVVEVVEFFCVETGNYALRFKWVPHLGIILR
jgi:hypothetical protein